jgi:hypothetical protein
MERYVREDRLVKALTQRLGYAEGSKTSIFNTMLHGDFWSNNVLFRWAETSFGAVLQLHS